MEHQELDPTTWDKRSGARRDLIYFLDVVDLATNRAIGQAKDISVRGIGITCSDRVERDAILRLGMKLPSAIDGKDKLGFTARVRWCRESSATPHYDAGIEVENIGKDELKVLQHLCSSGAVVERRTLTAKRLLDLVASAFGLVLLFPVFLAIGIAIRISSGGPILYGATRVGIYGKPFRMLKFRTMSEAPEENGPRITAHDDPRITRIGRILRQTKLNELPQLLNVLRGEMSLVGPRPEYQEFVAHYAAEYREVLSLRPGITSLATILYSDEEQKLNFASVTETYLRSILPDKLRLDRLYVQNRSMLLDLDILFRTALVLIPRFRNAVPRVEDILLGPLRKARLYLSWFVIDSIIAFLAVGMAGLIWRSVDPLNVGIGWFLTAALAMTIIFSVTNWLTGLQRVQWRFASPSEVIDVIFSSIIASILTLSINSRFLRPRLPEEILLFACVAAAAGFLTARYHRRLLIGLRRRTRQIRGATLAGRERVLIVGSGDTGHQLIEMLRYGHAAAAFHVVGIVDDDLSKLGTSVHRVPVLGLCERVAEIAREYEIGTILFAIHRIDNDRRQHILQLCEGSEARVVIIPDLLAGLRHSVSVREDGQVEAKDSYGSTRAALDHMLGG